MYKQHPTFSRRFLHILCAAVLSAALLTGCTAQNASASGSSAAAAATSATSSTAGTGKSTAVTYNSEDEDASWDTAKAVKITLNGSSISSEGSGVKVSGVKATITAAGTYVVSGTLSDGQIIVDAGDKAVVRLVLNGADITCSTSAPIYVKNAEKAIVILADGTTNKIADGTSYTFDDTENQEPDAALFSKSNLTINGSGSLTVTANYKDGIAGKDDLKITGGNITIHAAGDGIRGRDCVGIKNAVITITAKADGIKSTNDEDKTKGYIDIAGKTITINAQNDGVQAETSVLITGGDLSITTNGGSSNKVDSSDVSYKGIKSGSDINIESGNITIDSADDCLHTSGILTIDGGTFSLSSGDDGAHADSSLIINGGTITIKKSYEGLEAAFITLNNGSVDVTASDDGVNAAGGNDGSSVNGRPGQNNFQDAGNYMVTIAGGTIVVNAGGDGLDSNGSITMTGGTAIVNGPTDNGNGPLDYNGTFKMTGGYLLAAGSSGMAQAPDTSSTQYAVMINFDSALTQNTMVHIQSDSGEDILTFVPAKQYQSVVLCSPALKNGTTYHVFTGGSSTGTQQNGLYTGGTYSGGTSYKDFTVSSIVTTVGTASTMGPGGGQGGQGGGQMPNQNGGRGGFGQKSQ
jgi:hypothetical protein